MDALSIATHGFLVSDVLVVESEPIILYGRLTLMQIKHYIGDTGKTIIINCGEDISGATSTKIKVKKPDGVTTTWNASIYAMGGRYNYIKYVTVGPTVTDESVDSAISGTLVVAHYPVTTPGNIALYTGATLTDTLIPGTPVGNVVTFSGAVGNSATLNILTGSLLITANPGINHAKFSYVFSGDFNVSGKYELQAYVETGDFRGHGTTDYIVVSERFD